MPYALRSLGPLAEKYLRRPDGTLEITSPSKTGLGQHTKFIYDETTPRARGRRVSAPELLPTPRTPSPSPEREEPRIPQTPVPDFPYRADSVLHTPKKKKANGPGGHGPPPLLRSPTAVGVNNIRTYFTSDSFGSLEEWNRMAQAEAREKMSRDTETERESVEAMQKREAEKIFQEQWPRWKGLEADIMEVDETDDMDSDFDASSVASDATTEILDTSSFSSYGAPLSTYATRHVSWASSAEYVPFSRQPTVIIDEPLPDFYPLSTADLTEHLNVSGTSSTVVSGNDGLLRSASSASYVPFSRQPTLIIDEPHSDFCPLSVGDLGKHLNVSTGSAAAVSSNGSLLRSASSKENWNPHATECNNRELQRNEGDQQRTLLSPKAL